MLSLIPGLHELVGSAASRTVAQLRALGVEPSERSTRIRVAVAPGSSPARWLLAASLIDLLLRLDPLVSEVVVDALGHDEAGLAADLAVRIPLTLSRPSHSVDYTVGVGACAVDRCDLLADAAGWVASIGAGVGIDDDGNPIGPLCGAALTAAEAFKWAFGAVYPEQATRLEMVAWRGSFSFFSYDTDAASPALPESIPISATLVGAGGVGAGFLLAVGNLGDRMRGSLDLVDPDVLACDNLNRVPYASLSGALTGVRKVVEATTWLRRQCSNLVVTGYPEDFDTFKHRRRGRADRTYDAVITGLDGDEARWEVQRDLPRILIDGATGRDMVARVERVEFGRYGCLGCTRRANPAASGAPLACDAPPDPHAPSLSFLSLFPGLLAAGELIKEGIGSGMLRGHFDHAFRYGPNPDLRGTPAIRADCVVGCSRASKLHQYRQKYPARAAR